MSVHETIIFETFEIKTHSIFTKTKTVGCFVKVLCDKKWQGRIEKVYEMK